MEEVMSMTSAFKVEQCALPDNIAGLLEKNNKTVVLHPKSQGSALEWPLESYLKLANELVAKGYTVYFTGTEQEGDLFRSSLPINDNIIDLTDLLYFSSEKFGSVLYGSFAYRRIFRRTSNWSFFAKKTNSSWKMATNRYKCTRFGI